MGVLPCTAASPINRLLRRITSPCVVSSPPPLCLRRSIWSHTSTSQDRPLRLLPAHADGCSDCRRRHSRPASSSSINGSHGHCSTGSKDGSSSLSCSSNILMRRHMRLRWLRLQHQPQCRGSQSWEMRASTTEHYKIRAVLADLCTCFIQIVPVWSYI